MPKGKTLLNSVSERLRKSSNAEERALSSIARRKAFGLGGDSDPKMYEVNYVKGVPTLGRVVDKNYVKEWINSDEVPWEFQDLPSSMRRAMLRDLMVDSEINSPRGGWYVEGQQYGPSYRELYRGSESPSRYSPDAVRMRAEDMANYYNSQSKFGNNPYNPNDLTSQAIKSFDDDPEMYKAYIDYIRGTNPDLNY